MKGGAVTRRIVMAQPELAASSRNSDNRNGKILSQLEPLSASSSNTHVVSKLEQYACCQQARAIRHAHNAYTAPFRRRVHAEAALVSVDACVCMSLDQ
jgi:hypothetical protein